MKSPFDSLPSCLRLSSLGALAVATLLTAGPGAAEVTLINVFEVPEGRLDDAVAGWETARDFLSERPGYISTALHQSLTDEARFRLINVAVWESPEAFATAARAMADEGVFPRIEGLGVNPALYRVIRSDD